MSGIAGQLLLYTVWPTSPGRLFIISIIHRSRTLMVLG
jgi:hypothetical protein